MSPNWNDNQPIYIQLREHALGMILDGVLDDGDPLPSVRKVAADFHLNSMRNETSCCPRKPNAYPLYPEIATQSRHKQLSHNLAVPQKGLDSSK